MKKKYLQETLNALRKILFDSPIMKGKLVQLKDGIDNLQRSVRNINKRM
ncbi:hypothetical protein IMSAG044_01668 [Lactobacillaceae bacterium]|nr:hypothetical protein [Lactobacillus intestinalis]GFI60772.1 hypothetical protein IMSAG044_01668 [Lactobacillaceae bacterium]